MESRADILLGGRLGQAMLADLAGLDPLVLLAAEGKLPPAGVTFLESSSSSGLRALRWSRRPRRAHRDAGTWPEWMDPDGKDAATIIGAAVASTVQASAERSWLFFKRTPQFDYYSLEFLPFLVLCITLCLKLIIGPARASPRRRAIGAAIAGMYVLAVLILFWYFYPILAGQIIPYSSWSDRMWYRGWI